MRPPHIHFEVHARFERLITQMYFPHEPLNTSDRLLNAALRPDLLVATCLSDPWVVAFCISTLSYHGDRRFPSTRPTPAGSRSCESPLRANSGHSITAHYANPARLRTRRPSQATGTPSSTSVSVNELILSPKNAPQKRFGKR